MYTNIANVMYSNKIFAAGLKCYELVKLAVKPSMYKNNNSKEYLPYILNAVSKGYTVIDVGSHRRGYIFDLLKISKLPGRLIAFETGQSMYSYLLKMKQILDLRNILIDPFPTSGEVDKTVNAAPYFKRDNVGAMIVDFNAAVNKPGQESYTP